MSRRKLFVVGDSISMQYGPYLAQYVRGSFDYARKTGAEGVSSTSSASSSGDSANGGDSSMVRGYLEGMVAAGKLACDLLLVNCGLHDIKADPQTGKKQVPIEDYRRNLHAIVQLVEPLPVQLVWVRTTPCDEAVHNKPTMAFYRYAADGVAYNAAADAIMQEADVPSIDLYGFTRQLGEEPYCDHVHFHEEIRKLQAAYIAGWLAANA